MSFFNRQGLEGEFDMPEATIEDIEQEVDEFEREWEQENMPQEKIKDNIERANEILDTILSEINGGNMEPRMFEVAGQLVNSVTAAAKELMSDENYKRYLQLREEMVKLKKIEIDKKFNRGPNVTNQNLIITNREDLLKIIGSPKQLPNSAETEDNNGTEK